LYSYYGWIAEVSGGEVSLQNLRDGGSMSQFSIPVGITFCCVDEPSATQISNGLCRIVSFLHHHRSLGALEQFDDWLEHDGLHFHRTQFDVHRLFEIISSARSILEATPDDENVFIGIAPSDREWYLRFRAEWDEAGNSVVGRFDITFPSGLAESFRQELVPLLECKLLEESSATYFSRITV
jgi:hypothetical protein